MAKLMLAPDQAGYSATDGEEVLSVKLDGGASRRRHDVLGATATIKAGWTLTAAEYDYMKAFYRVYRTAAFTIDLILDDSELSEYEAHFAGPPSLREIRGLAIGVEAELEVTPHVRDVALDDMLLSVADGSIEYDVFAALARLVNEWPVGVGSTSSVQSVSGDLVLDFLLA
jgi:hypothetical protein